MKKTHHPAPADQFSERLDELIRLSPDVRFGQVLANLGLLTDAHHGLSLWEIEHDDLISIMTQHRDELARRSATDADPSPSPSP